MNYIKNTANLRITFINLEFYISYMSQEQQISVNGSAEVKYPPDNAIVNIRVKGRANDESKAVENIAERIDELENTINELEYIVSSSTQRFNVRTYEDDDSGVYYNEAVSVQSIVIDDVDSVGDFVSNAMNSGGSEVEGFQYTLSEESEREARNEAIQIAIREAKEDATVAAESLGLKIDKPSDINVNRTNITPNRGNQAAFELSSASIEDTNAPNIDSSDVSVNAKVSIKYLTKNPK